MRKVWTHNWAPSTSPKLKSMQDLSIRVNPEVPEVVVHHAGLRVDGSLHLRLHVCKVIHPSLKSSDPFHCVLSLVNPITDVSLQRSVPVRIPGRGGGSMSHPVFKAKTRCSLYVCPGSSCHTYGQNVSTEYQCLYYIVSCYKNLLQVQNVGGLVLWNSPSLSRCSGYGAGWYPWACCLLAIVCCMVGNI
jgi:hypothetical protein